MKVSVLGAGNAGCAVAADLTIKGHTVNLVKTSQSMHNANFEFLVKNDGEITLDEFGEIKKANISHVTRDLKVISESEVVIIYIQSLYHESLIKRIVPFLRDNQLVIINPGYLSTAFFLKHCDKNIMIAEAESSFIDGRLTKPGYFTVGFRNVRNPVGVFPSSRKNEAKKLLDQLDENIVLLESVVEAALHNPNMIVHTVGSLLSIPRIEIAKSDFCMYHEAYSRENVATLRVLEILDHEKISVLEALGISGLSYFEACKYRNSLDDNIDAKEIFLEYAEMKERAKGPISINSRYIEEDVPEGLVLLESLGIQLKVKTPICTALINIANAALDKDFRKMGRSIKSLSKESLDIILNDR